MPRFKKLLQRNQAVLFVGIILIVFYFFSRLYHLKNVPYFLDELIYGRWAQQGSYDPELRLVSLVDGKQPLYIWLSTAAMHFVNNPVAAERIVSIIAGFGTAVGLYFLSFVLFKNKWVGLVSSLLYILLPFALVINRLGIYESLGSRNKK